ncbi:MAG: LapA family protein [Sphingobium sp.]|nr:LapA family protein [Sphingobium sp.]
MNFLRTAFWVIVAVALALFTKANWSIATDYSGYVPVKLWGDIIVEARLPVLILAAFLLGLVPSWLWSRAVQWRLQRKLASTEKMLASALASTTADGDGAATGHTAGIAAGTESGWLATGDEDPTKPTPPSSIS